MRSGEEEGEVGGAMVTLVRCVYVRDGLRRVMLGRSDGSGGIMGERVKEGMKAETWLMRSRLPDLFMSLTSGRVCCTFANLSRSSL